MKHWLANCTQTQTLKTKYPALMHIWPADISQEKAQLSLRLQMFYTHTHTHTHRVWSCSWAAKTDDDLTAKWRGFP